MAGGREVGMVVRGVVMDGEVDAGAGSGPELEVMRRV